MAQVKGTMPAHHSDPRYAYGLCLAAAERVAARAEAVAEVAQAPLQQKLLACRARWTELYMAQAADVPEPWLGDGKGGIEWDSSDSSRFVIER